MKKINRLKHNQDFNKIIEEGRKSMNSHFIIYYAPSLSFDISTYRIGVSVGKKFGNAVQRNHQKRIVRSIITNLTINVVKYDYVIISRPACKNTVYLKQADKLSSLIKEIK